MSLSHPSIRLRAILFIGFTLLSSLPVFLLGYWVQKSALKNEIDAVQEKHLLVARNLTNALSRYASDTRALFNFVTGIDAATFSTLDTDELLSALHFKFIYITDRNGRIESWMFHSDGAEFPHAPELITALMTDLENNKTRFIDLMIDHTQEPVIHLVRKLNNDRVAVGALRTTYMIQLQQAITFGKLGHAAIVDSSGHVMAHPKKEWQDQSRDISGIKPIKQMKASDTGVSRFFSPAVGAEMVAGFSVVPETGWGAMIPQPMSELEQHANRIRMVALYILVGGVFLAALLSWWLAGWFSRPLRSVADAAKEISLGNLHSTVKNLPRMTSVEVNEMAHAFNHMANELTEKNREVIDKTAILEVTMDNMTEGIALVDTDHHIRLHNRQLNALLNLPSTLSLTNERIDTVFDGNKTIKQLFPPKSNTLDITRFDSKPGQAQTREINLNGGKILEVRYNTLEDGCSVMTCVDITERKMAEAHIQYLATHDVLTGLSSRHAFDETLDNAIQQNSPSGNSIHLLYMDLDRFKDVNDSFGHGFGDRVLKSVALRIQSIMDEGQIVARFGGDEFAILLSPGTPSEEARVIAEKLVSRLADPICIDEHDIYIRTSIGITIFPQDGSNPEELLKRADLAMYASKNRGSGGYCFYEKPMSQTLAARKDKESRLRKSVEAKEFEIHYQPIYDAATRHIVCCEALIRWRRGGSLVLPDEFLPVAEDTGLIIPIGDWVIHEVVQQISRWAHPDTGALQVAINLSATQFLHGNLAARILSTLENAHVDPTLLMIEITENTALRNERQVLEVLNTLAAKGIQLSMDDFGTGYSSLSHLKRFPVGKVKIDKSFTANIGVVHDDTAIVTTIINLCHDLKLPVIAEGVETAEQLAFLEQAGCDQIQGFYFSAAVNADELTALLRQDSEVRNRSTQSTISKRISI